MFGRYKIEFSYIQDGRRVKETDIFWGDNAQEAVDKRAAERKRWGHPPKSIHMGYKQPVKKVKPNARSRIQKRSGQRRA